MKSVLALLFVAFACVLAAKEATGTNWALLVAGSSGYYNYRHQSDVCHAYHVLTDPKKGNFPAENVIVMMYDDIANNTQNPVKGNMINHPNGVNVYPGVSKDYTGSTVTPQNFLNILSGNEAAMKGIGSGRVIKSTSKDRVFVYFADHGATGLIAFPSSYLYATDLMKTLTAMYNNKQYSQLVFYIEACESGSMFQDLSDNMNIFATTAATASQSSYACYYDATRATYLGDEYSVRWMEDSDQHDFKESTWTLEQQFKLVVNETKMSNPQQFGDLKISTLDVEDFQGYDMPSNKLKFPGFTKKPKVKDFTPCGNAVDVHDIKYDVLSKKYEAATTPEQRNAIAVDLVAEVMHRSKVDQMFKAIVASAVGESGKDVFGERPTRVNDFECLKSSIDAFEKGCMKLDEYALKYVYTLVNLCESGINGLTSIITDVCSA